jgi:hypothetical protein
MRFGSREMSDNEFLEAISACRYPPGSFHHADHLRLGWILRASQKLLYRFRNEATLRSPRARTGWVPPDVQPLPPVCGLCGRIEAAFN